MQPILRDVPFEFESERLVIRGPLPGDGPATRAAVLASHAELRPWMPWAAEVADEADYEANVRQAHVKYLLREDLRMLLWHKVTGEFVGSSGMHAIDWDVPRFEIGYWCHSAHTGNGYVTEAVRAIAAMAFDTLGAQRVEIRCDTANAASAAVARRAGFEHEATLRRHDRHLVTGELTDTDIYVRLAHPDPS